MKGWAAAAARVTRRRWPECSGRRYPREKVDPEGRPQDGGYSVEEAARLCSTWKR
jgi:hypothetical protein